MCQIMFFWPFKNINTRLNGLTFVKVDVVGRSKMFSEDYEAGWIMRMRFVIRGSRSPLTNLAASMHFFSASASPVKTRECLYSFLICSSIKNCVVNARA